MLWVDIYCYLSSCSWAKFFEKQIKNVNLLEKLGVESSYFLGML